MAGRRGSRRLLGTFVLLLVTGLTGGYTAPRQATLAEADKLYAEKSYAGALKGYEEALKAGAVPAARRDEVRYRSAVSLGKSEKWDRALQASLDFVKQHRGSVWEARGCYWLGRLYLALPHQGYRVGTKFFRGNDVPKTEGTDVPQYMGVWEQDQQNARDALEAARVLFPSFRAAGNNIKDEIQLDFDLSRILSSDSRFHTWASKPDVWTLPDDPFWKVNPAQTFALDWPTPKKQMYLFAEMEELAKSLAPTEAEHTTALALLAKAMWLEQYQQQMRSYAVRYENDKAISIPYPYQTLKPEDSLHQIITRFSNDPVRDQAQILLADWLQQKSRFAEARKEYENLIAERPQSKWVEDARAGIYNLEYKSLNIASVPPVRPGKPVEVTVDYRNVRSIHFRLYRVKLETLLPGQEVRKLVGSQLNQFYASFGTLKEAEKSYGPLLKEWDYTTKRTTPYAPGKDIFPLPDFGKEAGGFVLEASAPSVRAATVVLVSDLVLIQKMHRDGALFFVTRAGTGAPVGGAKIVVKQWWQEIEKKTGIARQKAVFDYATANAEGTVNVPLRRRVDRSSFQVSAMAYAPVSGQEGHASHYALTNPRGWYYGSNDYGAFSVYSTTDRSVYRPQQTVHYRQLVMRRLSGELKPLANKSVKIVVTDPSGATIHKKTALSSEFGSVNGTFDLPTGAPLGEYYITCTVPRETDGQMETGQNRFRVEEYKKPEFEVTVTPEANRVRLGEPTSAKIAAKYYFGGPVPNAKVTYVIHRTPYYAQYHFPQPFEFLWHYWNGGDYETSYRNGPVIKQGEARTDENGEAKVEFPTTVPPPHKEGEAEIPDEAYTVDVTVQDASRRVINGSGTVKATKHNVAVFLNYPHGYATKGDRLDVEIRTLNPSDQPVSVSGMAKVYRLPDTADPKAKEKLVHEEPLKTDKEGRAYLRWTTQAAGRYRVAFVTRDTREEIVEGSTSVWVDGPELRRGRFLHQGLFLAVKNPYYEEGQTAKVLIVAPEPGCTVLVSREVDNEIMDKRVLHIAGRSLEVDVPLHHADVPNVYLNVVAVRNGEMLSEQVELFVPPVKQFTTVTVQADKARYQPGEKAKFKLAAKDWQGRPLRTELSVSVADAALSYIQKDYSPDIRVFFYGNRRSVATETSGSPNVGFDSQQEDTQAQVSFTRHSWTLPDGMGMLPEWPGERYGDTGLITGGLGRPGFARGGGLGGEGRGDDFVINGARQESLVLNAPVAAPGAPAHVAKAKSEAVAYDVDNTLIVRYDTDDKLRSLKEAVRLADTQIRRKFADTAFWTPAVVTDAQGAATVQVTWPDNLTQWRAQAVGTSQTAQVGSGEARVTTKKDLLVRLQTPRFFVERDEVLLTANVQNSTDSDASVQVKLDLTGIGGGEAEVITPDTRVSSTGSQPLGAGLLNAERPTPNASLLRIPKNGEKRMDWRVHIKREGGLRVRMTAQSEKAADAMETVVPVLVHGVERMTAQSGVMRRDGAGSATVNIELPEARKPGSSELVVQLNPSLSAVMLDSLPYLADYPYGCIEQTMSRFLPSVVVAKTLHDLGYNLDDLRKRAKTLRDQAARNQKSKIQNPKSNSAYTYPKGVPGMATLPSANSNFPRLYNPVFSEQTLNRMVTAGLKRIHDAQHSDGGWGWWPDDTSDAYMTAYVLYGLQTARDAGYKDQIAEDEVTRGLNFLRDRFLHEEDLHRMAYQARILAMAPAYRDAIRPLVTGRLYDRRERLSPYSKALLALALHLVGDAPKANVLLRNLESTAKVDEANGTANWENGDRYWWRWYNNKVETNATILQAYLAINPNAKLPAFVMKWLVNNRRGDAWPSTKETAEAVYALADYARVNKEFAADYTLTVDLGGRVRRNYKINHETALFGDNQFIVPDALLQTGAQPLTITRNGTGTLYYAAYTRYFSLEEPIKETGNEVFVHRRYFRLLAGTAKGAPEPTPLAEDRANPFLTGKYELLTIGGDWTAAPSDPEGAQYDRVELKDGETVASGDLLEVQLELESKNDYDYLVFEDMKPAGCEPVEVRSGGKEGLGVYSNRELRDQKVAFFLSSLPQGTRMLSYRLRAETPGQFHVLPTNGYAMYAPDVRTLSDEWRMGIKDEDPEPH